MSWPTFSARCGRLRFNDDRLSGLIRALHLSVERVAASQPTNVMDGRDGMQLLFHQGTFIAGW